MNLEIFEEFKNYIDAKRPIIYFSNGDFKLISQFLNKNFSDYYIYEYNDAQKGINIKDPGEGINFGSLTQFLSIFLETQKKIFLILNDAHFNFENPEVIAFLKSISQKRVYDSNYFVSIIIISDKLVIPYELNKFITVVDIPLPNYSEIKDSISIFIDQKKITQTSKDTINKLALTFCGLSQFEINQILELIYIKFGFLESEHESFILDQKKQIIKKSGLLEIVQNQENFNDIGGLDALKLWLENKAKIFNNRDEALIFGVEPPKGILILGMPGCGKSLTAKAVSNAFGFPLLRLDIGKLMGKYVGESEENLRKAIKIAESVSPCVLWIDELEKAFSGLNSGGSNEVILRLFGFFLTWIQENKSPVFIVATSNDITNIPAELLRKGRLDELFFVDFPDLDERKEIFEIHVKKRNQYNEQIDYQKLANMTEGFSGADIESVVRESLEELFINNKNLLTNDILHKIIKNTQPLSKSQSDKINLMIQNLKNFDIKNAKSDKKKSDNNENITKIIEFKPNLIQGELISLGNSEKNEKIKIIFIHVKRGQQVQAGKVLLLYKQLDSDLRKRFHASTNCIIKEIYVKENQEIEAGQNLFLIDSY